jgi:uncharacterized membrane protein
MGSGPTREPEALRAELLLSRVLRGGVLTSVTLILTDIVVSFIHHPTYLSSPKELMRLTRSGAGYPHTVRDVLAGLGAVRGQAITTLGLLLLIGTPVARVAASILLFVEQGDRTYVAITVTVFVLLLVSFVFGAVG